MEGSYNIINIGLGYLPESLKERIEMQKTSEQKELAKIVGKLLRDTFGRGPEFIDVSVSHQYLCFYLKNFMSPMEQILMSNEKEDIVIKRCFDSNFLSGD